MLKYYSLILVVIGGLLIFFAFSGMKETAGEIKLPAGFVIETFAEGLGESQAYPGPNTGPRFMEFVDGTLVVSLTGQGKVVSLPDTNKDREADKTIEFLSGLNRPHGLAVYNDWIYIAEEDKVIRVKYANSGELKPVGNKEALVPLPAGGGHFTRTISIFNNSLYVSIGSSCNVCYEQDNRRAAILKCSIEGKDCELFASGLRNSVGFVFQGNELWATENGRDLLGDDLPPEEINIVREGQNYGWPICYGNKIHDTDFDKNVYIRNPCEDTEPAFIELQAHSAPLGLAFYFGNNFPEKYKGNLFVAYHGSWNRREPTGYKIVRIDTETKQVEDFATGWLKGPAVTGRPVDIVVAEDGSMLVSDDNAGKIYRIWYKG